MVPPYAVSVPRMDIPQEELVRMPRKQSLYDKFSYLIMIFVQTSPARYVGILLCCRIELYFDTAKSWTLGHLCVCRTVHTYRFVCLNPSGGFLIFRKPMNIVYSSIRWKKKKTKKTGSRPVGCFMKPFRQNTNTKQFRLIGSLYEYLIYFYWIKNPRTYQTGFIFRGVVSGYLNIAYAAVQ